MIGLDTNVLVRYIMQDDPKNSPKANKLIESLDGDNPGYITIVSVIELYWVLTSCYELTGEQVGQRWRPFFAPSHFWWSVRIRSCVLCEFLVKVRLTLQTA
jgi:predicted nucleic acid-binding protein